MLTEKDANALAYGRFDLPRHRLGDPVGYDRRAQVFTDFVHEPRVAVAHSVRPRRRARMLPLHFRAVTNDVDWRGTIRSFGHRCSCEKTPERFVTRETATIRPWSDATATR